MKRRACAAACAAAGWTALAWPAISAAQERPGATSASAGDRLEEVVVTATKQAQSVDVGKVPISISAYSQQDLDSQGVKSIAEIAAMTPGVNFSQENQYGGTAQTNIEIRGVQSRTSAPTTAIYLDDTPLVARASQFNNGASLIYPQVFDLERVEVLRGPQGTLFGAGAEGGAVRFISTAPSLTTQSSYARTEVSWTRYGSASYEAGAATGGPIMDGTLGFRVSAWYRQDGGYLDRCQPAVMQAGCLGISDTNVNSSNAYVVRAALLWQPMEGLRVTPSLFYQRQHYDDGGGYEIADSDPAHGKFVFGLASALPATDPLFIPTLKVEADLPGATLTSVTSYVWRKFDFQTDYTQLQDFAFFGNPYPLTGAPDDFARGDYVTRLNNLYEELRIASARRDSPVAWVAGLYGEDARQFDHAQVEHPDLPALFLANYGQTIEQVLGVPPYQGKWVYYGDMPEHDRQFAVFGNADVKLSPSLQLNLGVRWATFSTDTGLFLAGPFNGGTQQFAGSTTYHALTPKAGLTWQPDEDNTYYLSAGKGYRAGGVNAQTGSLIPTCNVTVPEGFRPDSLRSYEIGAKNRLLDRRLAIDSSVFFIDWNDIQTLTNIAQCGIGAVLNLGRAVSKGFDMSLRALVTHDLKLGVQVGYTRAYFKDTTALAGVGQVVAAGDAIAGASDVTGAAIPPWSIGLSGEYDFTLGSRSAFVSFQDLFHSRNNGPFSSHNAANVVQYDPNLPTDPSTNVLNLRGGMHFDHADAMLFVNNALSSHPQLAVNHSQTGDLRLEAATFRPLTVGVAANFQF